MAATSTKELTATGASVTTVSAGSDATAPPPLEPWSAGAPTAAVVPAGQCAIGEDWTPCPLLERLWVSKDTIVVTFGLADAKPLNLSTCACVLARGGADAAGEPFVRPYTPVSTNALAGKFQLMMKVTILYGSRSSDNILAKATLDDWSASHAQLTVVHVLSHEPEGSASPHARGFIDEKLVEDHLPKPGDDALLFVCGPPPLYDALCGPRGEADAVTGLLGDLGWGPAQVVKF
ncbi:cytochrome-b5 reductase [Aureococcus anophagefferens]|nr:cytochrome-b5 reductase [Aureococcus anophagefferens]